MTFVKYIACLIKELNKPVFASVSLGRQIKFAFTSTDCRGLDDVLSFEGAVLQCRTLTMRS